MQSPAVNNNAKLSPVHQVAISAAAGARRVSGAGNNDLAVVLQRRPHRPVGALLAVAPPNASALAEAVCTTTTAKNNTNNEKQLQDVIKLREDKYFETEMTVQDCELDKYGVVNNSIYASYIEKAREELLLSLGISTGLIICTGNLLALSELNLKYYTPLRRGDKFVVRVRLVRIKGVRIFAEHIIETMPDRKLVVEATATVVCLNKDYRPTRVFPEMSDKLQRFFST
ncbi:acyl-acyl carrier protein thioesterase ATL4, chloroplastic [Brachypodium distachyon]|uniref:Uncharacterized protein n=1 Tax=Brachypodium distachyon TaxID=15368 RepID=I1GUU1_BRADI|nr:acyl-acyl carrier protein thioesterase ATL4, chloroplastic [Brachypodium distachyon]KQK16449.1 hypothetical protein BRADI_1g28810v3 [Brachypodium distachyon]PNT75220.1 hypothetical protein BRADI_1g28810v3 [Brachypodium distachyon]|eukprot:XP_003563181.1 acyl-acyl carrier protein thioesterase ATL4, chloroplastic [Brachypodium distachyon]